MPGIPMAKAADFPIMAMGSSATNRTADTVGRRIDWENSRRFIGWRRDGKKGWQWNQGFDKLGAQSENSYRGLSSQQLR
ncbi:hypothetical protein [Planococcus lenghuensis]|uniref:hypothetical protein n=1 Tax=Planococcus lenghuensis TaxID=2213202 RepID=UPI001E39A6D3|nr:hypothetical protein [Planococcus lenghuensis]